MGWISSVILIATIAKQVHKQWTEGMGDGVSRWLFVGQCAASLGFVAYSWLIHDWVFVVTNAVMLVAAVLGLYVLIRDTRDTRGGGRRKRGAPGRRELTAS